LLLAHALGLKRLDLYLQFERTLTDAERDRVRPLVVERGRGVPVAYLTGEREFYSLAFRVDRSVLVPRPETELLVEAAAQRLADRPAPVVADVGTGSGCVAVALLHSLEAARGHALDRSAGALLVARANAERHRVAARLLFHAGDLLEPLSGGPDWGRLDLVVSNPPYVVRGDPGLAPDVAAHEPPEALYVEGNDPLAVAMRLAEQSLGALAPGGCLALEVGAGSAADAITRLTALGYADARSLPDLAGIERVVVATRV
jgi:release factor glutamine methyltransferase